MYFEYNIACDVSLCSYDKNWFELNLLPTSNDTITNLSPYFNCKIPFEAYNSSNVAIINETEIDWITEAYAR